MNLVQITRGEATLCLNQHDCALLAEACNESLNTITSAARTPDIRALEAWTALLQALEITCTLQNGMPTQ